MACHKVPRASESCRNFSWWKRIEELPQRSIFDIFLPLPLAPFCQSENAPTITKLCLEYTLLPGQANEVQIHGTFGVSNPTATNRLVVLLRSSVYKHRVAVDRPVRWTHSTSRGNFDAQACWSPYGLEELLGFMRERRRNIVSYKFKVRAVRFQTIPDVLLRIVHWNPVKKL